MNTLVNYSFQDTKIYLKQVKLLDFFMIGVDNLDSFDIANCRD